MGGAVGKEPDTFLNTISAGLGGSENFSNIKGSAEDIQASIMGEKMEEEETDTSSANPFSRANLSNSMRRKNKSGFGRRQTFKGLTG